MVSFTHEQKINICSQTRLDDIFIAHEQTIICRQLFAGHVVGSRPMKRRKNLPQMIICFTVMSKHYLGNFLSISDRCPLTSLLVLKLREKTKTPLCIIPRRFQA